MWIQERMDWLNKNKKQKWYFKIGTTKKKMKALNIRPKFKIGDLKILELDCSFCIFFLSLVVLNCFFICCFIRQV